MSNDFFEKYYEKLRKGFIIVYFLFESIIVDVVKQEFIGILIAC